MVEMLVNLNVLIGCIYLSSSLGKPLRPPKGCDNNDDNPFGVRKHPSVGNEDLSDNKRGFLIGGEEPKRSAETSMFFVCQEFASLEVRTLLRAPGTSRLYRH